MKHGCFWTVGGSWTAQSQAVDSNPGQSCSDHFIKNLSSVNIPLYINITHWGYLFILTCATQNFRSFSQNLIMLTRGWSETNLKR